MQNKIPNRPFNLSLIPKRVQEKLQYFLVFSHNHISFEHWERVRTKSLDEMARVLSKSIQVRNPKNIRRFTLDLKDCQDEMDEPMKLFAKKILWSLTQLNKLSISFKNGANVSEEFIETIGTIIRRQLRDLQDLSLDFSTCRQVTDRSLKDLGSMVGHPLSKLKCLSISLERCRSLTGTGLKVFGSHLTFGLRRRIHHLSLNFAGCFFDREGGFEGLMMKIFQRMKLLRSLNLNMANYGSLLSIYREINTSEFWRPMPELQHLSLDLSKCNILKDVNVASLLANISTCLINLQSLHLSFEKCEKISDECFKKMNLYNYQKLTLLKQFNISFLECPKITGKGLEVLSSKIAHNLIQIKQLDLSFGDFQSRDLFIDDNLENLGIEINRALKGLNHLVLRFHYCRMITDRGLKALGHEIAQNLQNLKSVTLIFHKCAKVTTMGRETLDGLLFAIPNKELYTD